VERQPCLSHSTPLQETRDVEYKDSSNTINFDRMEQKEDCSVVARMYGIVPTKQTFIYCKNKSWNLIKMASHATIIEKTVWSN
jgi:hypothetical protein